MSKPSLNANFDKTKFAGLGSNMGQMLPPQFSFNFPPGVSSSMMYAAPGLQGYPTMAPTNFSPAQFFQPGE